MSSLLEGFIGSRYIFTRPLYFRLQIQILWEKTYPNSELEAVSSFDSSFAINLKR